LCRAFFHDVRKVRVRAAETLAEQGETAYPLVVPLLRNSDGWVRCLTMWTMAELARGELIRQQAICDLRRALQHESDWFLYMTGKELLRKLGDDDVDALPERPQIPNLTTEVVDTLQELVDSQREPYRQAFKVYFIAIELCSLVYRRGLIGLDLDDLRIYVNDEDYFPPYYRYYKSGDLDIQGTWRGWRRLWIRGETPNYPDGPRIIEVPREQSDQPPQGARTIILYDHRDSTGRVQLPPIDRIIARYGLGKVKDRIRHALLEQWNSAFAFDEQVLLSRVHASALLTMLFGLPAEMSVSESEWKALQRLNRKTLATPGQKPTRVIKLVRRALPGKRQPGEPCTVQPQWLDSLKYSVDVFRSGAQPPRPDTKL
jgi:hypothetical protein